MRIVNFLVSFQVFETETGTKRKMSLSPVYITILQLYVYLWSTNAICYLAYDLCIYIVWKRNENNETKRNVAKKNMKNSIWHED